MKRCPKCKTHKPRNKFYPCKTRKDGLRAYCKVCEYAVLREWQENNKKRCSVYAKRIYSKKRKFYTDYKKSLRCQKCGENHSACLEFHHRNPSEKDFIIGQLAGMKSIKRLMDEIAKCDVLCANCHRKLHFRRNKK